MVDLTTNLGRVVPTARQVLEIARPQIKLALIVGVAHLALYSPVVDATDADGETSERLFEALLEDAMTALKKWAADQDPQFVFDSASVFMFLRQALGEAMSCNLSPGLVSVLQDDRHFCEKASAAFRRITDLAPLKTGETALMNTARDIRPGSLVSVMGC